MIYNRTRKKGCESLLLAFFKSGGLLEIIRFLSEYFNILSIWDLIKVIIDVGVVALIIFKLIQLIRETRAWQLLKGVLIILLATWVSDVIGLRTISFLLNNTIQLMAFALVVLFAPELRKALEKLGTSKFRNIFNLEEEALREERERAIEAVAEAAVYMSARRIGCLIVMEKDIKLGEIIQTGTMIDSKVTPELIEQIFIPNTPLHDGAIVIRKNRIVAASCFLPLTGNTSISKDLGTRHRSAIGITEVSDCITVVVSEETGKISVAKSGGLVRNYDKDSLIKVLKNYLIADTPPRNRKLLALRKEKDR